MLARILLSYFYWRVLEQFVLKIPPITLPILHIKQNHSTHAHAPQSMAVSSSFQTGPADGESSGPFYLHHHNSACASRATHMTTDRLITPSTSCRHVRVPCTGLGGLPGARVGGVLGRALIVAVAPPLVHARLQHQACSVCVRCHIGHLKPRRPRRQRHRPPAIHCHACRPAKQSSVVTQNDKEFPLTLPQKSF